jgi:hypothetical protein
MAEVAPRVSRSALAHIGIGSVLGEYETYFSRGGDQARRGKNIDVAAHKLDGLVLSPGELVSFNTVVGERSEENGFQKSWEIFKGEMIEGVGGGTCQVASTFHAAVLFAGLDILERLPHSRPSAYIPMGLDATVVYPIVDLKIKNPHSFPVVIHARTERNKLRIEVLGAARPVRVSFGRQVLETVPYGRKVAEDPRLEGNHVVVKQHGIRGFRVKRQRLLTFEGGRQRKESNTDFYPPTQEIYEVPPGFDQALLPPLPDPAADADEGATTPASPASASSATPSSNGSVASIDTLPAAAAAPAHGAGESLVFVDAPGAHAPSAAQSKPAKEMWLRR